jgi:hypothetical protein
MNGQPVLFKRYDDAGHPYWVMTRVAAHHRYTHTIKPLNDLLESLEFCLKEVK